MSTLEEKVTKAQDNVATVKAILMDAHEEIALMLKDFENLPRGVTIAGINEIQSAGNNLRMLADNFNNVLNTYNPPVMPGMPGSPMPIMPPAPFTSA